MCMCVLACLHVCMYVCIHVYAYGYMHLCMCVCVFKYVHGCICVCMHVCFYICLVLCNSIICVGPFDYSLLLFGCVSHQKLCVKNIITTAAILRVRPHWRISWAEHSWMNEWQLSLIVFPTFLGYNGTMQKTYSRFRNPLQNCDAVHFWALQVTPSVEFRCSKAKQIKIPPQPRHRAAGPWQPRELSSPVPLCHFRMIVIGSITEK